MGSAIEGQQWILTFDCLTAGAGFTARTGMSEGWGFDKPNWQQGSQTLNMQKSNHTVFDDPGKKWTNGF